MTPENLSKEQLINDLIELRQRVNELEKIKEDKERYLDEINRARALYEGLFEYAPDAIVVVSHEGRIIQANLQAGRLFGYAREHLIGADHDILVPEHFRKKHLENRNTYMSNPHTRQMGTGLELYGKKQHGSEFPVDISLGAMLIEDDLVVLAVIRDVTEQKKWEEQNRKNSEEILRRTLELKEAYKDMESFSYSVSHDLRAPLRIIDSLSDMLTKDYSDCLNQKGKNLFNLIRGNIQRMDQLIFALLNLSKVIGPEITKNEIDMEKVTTLIFNELKAMVPGRNIDVNIKKLPPADGDLQLIRQVFTNLLSNAIKFTRDKDVASIEIGGRQEGNENIYYVRDNGVGFNMEYSDKLFKVFQRLHTQTEFEGIGIGLSIVHRIIQRHGGRVWAEGKLNEGATFYFSLPNK